MTLRLVTDADRARLATLTRELTGLGWERMSPVFAVRASDQTRRLHGRPVPDRVRFGTRRALRSRQGSAWFTLRTASTDFDLVTGERLRRGGLDQRLYSIGDALLGDVVVPDVLLADGWVRRAHADTGRLLSLVHSHFGVVEQQVADVGPTLVRIRLAAWDEPCDH
jgi:hypothetical protein